MLLILHEDIFHAKWLALNTIRHLAQLIVVNAFDGKLKLNAFQWDRTAK